jgi:hypothetical protein
MNHKSVQDDGLLVTWTWWGAISILLAAPWDHPVQK